MPILTPAVDETALEYTVAFVNDPDRATQLIRDAQTFFDGTRYVVIAADPDDHDLGTWRIIVQDTLTDGTELNANEYMHIMYYFAGRRHEFQGGVDV